MKSIHIWFVALVMGMFVAGGCAPTEEQVAEEQAIHAEVQNATGANRSVATAQQAVGGFGCYCSAAGRCCCDQGGQTTCVTCRRCENGGILGQD